MSKTTEKISRRKLIAKGALASSALLFASQLEADAAQDQPEGTPASYTVYRTEYKVKPLPFDPGKLRGISEKLIVSHHDKNYAGAIRRLAGIQKRIAALPSDAPPYLMGSLKREELIAMNSMILHELYFGNLGGSGGPAGNISRLIKESYGSIESWEHEFKLTGKSLAGGSGWVILAYSLHDKNVHNVWASDHQVNLAYAIPLLVMDMYEHSYQIDYGADATAYIDAFFKNVDWHKVDQRATTARSTSSRVPDQNLL